MLVKNLDMGVPQPGAQGAGAGLGAGRQLVNGSLGVVKEVVPKVGGAQGRAQGRA